MLQGKKILLGVTGSIAIYKSLELVRLFVKAGAAVRVIMSEDAKKFITPLSFEALSAQEVLHVNTESWTNDNNHIHIGKWADLFIIAPTSANTINKLACGIADNLLLSSALAFNKTTIIAPSANTNMLLNPRTQESVHKLKKLGFIVVDAQDKLLACNDKGIGAMSEPQEIFDVAARVLLQESFWSNKEVIITGGGTQEKIDDVRCLSNFSSGKMATALAYAFYLQGANVSLITSAKMLHIPLGVRMYDFESSAELDATLNTVLQAAKSKAYLFMASAVSDFVPLHVSSGKLKKTLLDEEFTLVLKKNKDILASLDKSNIFAIGFKAECDDKNALQNARDMLKEKKLDAVCLNVLGEKNNFGSSQNEITLITKESETSLALASKFEIAQSLAKLLKSL
ncbi:MAG: bifunctional phosphopantothenoylcysteine decarboxylase/phosphopantothenate--cysteine ligase CoaBC [Sulfurospirillum sp.]|nr:bifunctional phosphopantothenoylcysteine decarboxylase/phosphopantothenate--cysteine ligase CoaBC [Sulfurospirillum sp.]